MADPVLQGAEGRKSRFWACLGLDRHEGLLGKSCGWKTPTNCAPKNGGGFLINSLHLSFSGDMIYYDIMIAEIQTI